MVGSRMWSCDWASTSSTTKEGYCIGGGWGAAARARAGGSVVLLGVCPSHSYEGKRSDSHHRVVLPAARKIVHFYGRRKPSHKSYGSRLHSYYLPMDSWPSSVLLKNIMIITPTTQPTPPPHATLTIGAAGAL